MTRALARPQEAGREVLQRVRQGHQDSRVLVFRFEYVGK